MGAIVRNLPFLLGIIAIALCAGVIGLYVTRTRWYAILLRIAPPRYAVGVERAIALKMRDGIVLVNDHYFPRTQGNYATLLIRSPYGRQPKHGGFGIILTFFAYRFAERGYHVVTQDTRGRFDSGGEFDPYFYERDDGLDTVAWMQKQAWFNGRLGTWGPSYLGITQWALATASPLVNAMVPSISNSRLFEVVFPDEAFDLGLIMRWIGIFQALDRANGVPLWRGLRPLFAIEKTIAPAFSVLPLVSADQLVTGHPVPFYQKWMENMSSGSALWQGVAQMMQLEHVQAETLLMGGWYDFFLRGLLKDYTQMRAAGKKPYLTIGPWYHFSNSMIMTSSLREGLDWFDTYLKQERGRLRDKPVHLYVMGARQWRDFDDWPPPAQEQQFYLHSGFALSAAAPNADQSPDEYEYDPANPTPAVGGTMFSLGGGPRPNRKLEARPDVLVYTTEPLKEPLEIIGYVRLILYVRSSAAYTDFFGRLCDVHPNGRSINICDGLFRIRPSKGQSQPDGSLCIEIEMWATAHRFAPRHRIRLQVSSGAHPRWSRNLGTGEMNFAETEMKRAHQTIYHDREHPSALVVPVCEAQA